MLLIYDLALPVITEALIRFEVPIIWICPSFAPAGRVKLGYM